MIAIATVCLAAFTAANPQAVATGSTAGGLRGYTVTNKPVDFTQHGLGDPGSDNADRKLMAGDASESVFPHMPIISGKVAAGASTPDRKLRLVRIPDGEDCGLWAIGSCKVGSACTYYSKIDGLWVRPVFGWGICHNCASLGLINCDD